MCSSFFSSLLFISAPGYHYIVTDGYIYVYVGNQLLARTFDQAPLNVKYMSIGSFNAANIIYHYNCRTNDVNIKSIKAQ